MIVYECRFCDEIKSNALNLRNHALNHFKEPLLKLLPSKKPFKCPICENSSRDLTTLLRHYGFSHKMVFEYAKEDDFKAKCLEKKGPEIRIENGHDKNFDPSDLVEIDFSQENSE